MPLPALLVQTAQAVAVASDPISGHLVQGAVALILALQAWVIRAILPLRDDVRTIRQTLFGVNNDNGLNTDVGDLKDRVTECETYIETRKAVHGELERRANIEDRRHPK